MNFTMKTKQKNTGKLANKSLQPIATVACLIPGLQLVIRELSHKPSPIGQAVTPPDAAGSDEPRAIEGAGAGRTGVGGSTGAATRFMDCQPFVEAVQLFILPT